MDWYEAERAKERIFCGRIDGIVYENFDKGLIDIMLGLQQREQVCQKDELGERRRLELLLLLCIGFSNFWGNEGACGTSEPQEDAACDVEVWEEFEIFCKVLVEHLWAGCRLEFGIMSFEHCFELF